MADWHLYLLRTRMGTLYTGITTDVARRLDEHSGSGAGAKYLRAKQPLALVYEVQVGSRALASRVEYHMKQLQRKDKEAIVRGQPCLRDLLLQLNLVCEEESS